MDRVEQTIAMTRVQTWPRKWKQDLLAFEPTERELVLEAVALLDARPTDESGKP